MALAGAASLVLATPAAADVVTNANDSLRTGWYPDEGVITPQLVSGSSFGQLWSAAVDGQVYAQPLLSPTGVLVVASETDKVYGLDPATGAQKWITNVASAHGPWNPADVGCADIQPSIGTTATPVIDNATNTIYLTHKTYDDGGNAVWYMDALDVATGHEQSGWPVQLSGPADNHPSLTFHPQTQQQRPGLLLMNGVVYAGFGSHCDASPFEGWVFGVSTAGQIKARWASVVSGDGGGVWQAGTGLSSDSPGSILIATGNGGAPSTPAAGTSPPASCGECVIRLHVQSDGTLKPVDFFAPFDAAQLDQFDADFGSGGVVGLPDQYFGTSKAPHLAIVVGKEGYVYLLNRDSLGGYQQGAGGGDNVVQRLGPFGGVWGRPGVWPGDGGYVYIPTECCQNGGGELDVYKYGATASGDPSLTQVAHSSDVFGFGSGSPVITSGGTTSGSALVWIIWAANRQGTGGQLRAYDPVPVNGQPVLRWSASIGTATNYSTPGVGAGRLYVGTRDGHVLAFGSPVTQPLGGSGLSFPATTIGSSSTQTLTMTANKPITINSLSLAGSPSQFAWSNPSASLPVTLSTGQQLSVHVTFTPTKTGQIGDQLTAHTSAGDVSFSLQGTGQVNGPHLVASSSILSLGGTSVGGHLAGSVIFSNDGSQPVTITGVHAPAAPFSSSDIAAAANTQIAPGSGITVDVSFDPQTGGVFTPDIYSLGLDSNGGNVSVGLSASAGTPGNLQFSSEALDFGSTQIGTTATQSFTITNTGGTAVTVEKSKPPFGSAFAATTSLPEGTSVAPGQTLTETVTFTPTGTGAATGTWLINGNDASGLHSVQFTGTGASAVGASGSPNGTGPAGSGATPPASAARTGTPPKFAPSVALTTRLGRIYISYRARTAGVRQFVLERATAGRRGAHGCVAATSSNRSRAACTRFVVVARFSHRDQGGNNKLRLTAYVSARRLLAGSYRLRSILLGQAGAGRTLYASLRIVKPSPATRHQANRVAAGAHWGGAVGVNRTPMLTAVEDVLRRLGLAF